MKLTPNSLKKTPSQPRPLVSYVFKPKNPKTRLHSWTLNSHYLVHKNLNTSFNENPETLLSSRTFDTKVPITQTSHKNHK